MSRIPVRPFLAAALATLALPGALTASATAAPTGCNPTAGATCLAPFPSDFWSVRDPESPTGRRLQVDDAVLRPELLSQLPIADGIAPSGVFNGASGFSAGVGAVFEFAAKPYGIPGDGGTAVVAYDLDAGARVPVHAFFSEHANSDLVAKKTNTLQVFPRSRWPYGHRIVVAVTKKLLIPGSTEPDLAARMTTAQVEPEASYLASLQDGLSQAGVSLADVRNATIFTVRDRAEVIDRTQKLMDLTAAADHPIKYLQFTPDYLNRYVAGMWKGVVRLDNFRSRNGHGPVDWSGNTRKDQYVPFRLTVPRSAGYKAAPVAIYTHGIGAQKETDIVVTQMNAEHGLATFSIDWPNHGARAGADGGNLLNLLAPKHLGTLGGMFNQATVDIEGITKAIQTMKVDALNNDDWTWGNPLAYHGDGTNDIDGSKISLEGTSLGGVLGANYAGMTKTLKGIDFHVTGVGLSHAISQTMLWSIFGKILPNEDTGTEETVFMAAIQQVIDSADGINTIDFARYPRPGQTKKPMLIITGQSDTLVPNPTSVALANLVDLPLVGKQLYAMPGVRKTTELDADGYGLRQYPPFTGPIPIPILSGASAHGAFMNPMAFVAQGYFIDQWVKAP